MKKIERLSKCLCLILSVCCLIGVCSAFLTDADTNENTFTVGKVKIRLEGDAKNDYILVPGKNIYRYTDIVVEDGSAASYVFLQVEEMNNPGDFLDYDVNEVWNELPGYSGVYYTATAKAVAEIRLPVLKNNMVSVKESVKKEVLSLLQSYPELNFRAYAIQLNNITGPGEAWEILRNGGAER